MTTPELIDGHDPVYTREALKAEVEGTMVVKCTIHLDGKVENCRVLKTVQLVERAVLEALLSRRYRPATLQGRAVAVDYVFNIRLVLPDKD